MAWTNPTDPVSTTVITVAYAVANLLTQIRWLRTLTGGADPPGTGYMVTSDSTTATSWKNGVAPILAVLGYTPANPAGFTMTGDLIFGAIKGIIFRGNLGGTPTGLKDIATQGSVLNAHADSFEVYDQLLAFTAMFQAYRAGGVAHGKIGGNEIWHAGNLAYTPARIVASTYAGNNNATRQIALGFIPKYVVITWSQGATSGTAHITSATANTTTISVFTGAASMNSVSGDTTLHATDGFVVDAAGSNGLTNSTGTTYRYVAFG